MNMKEQFEKLQAAWLKAHEAERTMARTLEYKYGHTWTAPSGKEAKYKTVAKRADGAMEAIFAWLDINSPRSWRTGSPAYWVCTELTFEDAITAGALAVVPPPSYGTYQSDSLRFARAVELVLA
jgi:hypothetical protein